MKRCLAASCGLVFVLFSLGFLHAQEESTRSEDPAENRAIVQRLEILKDDVAWRRRMIVVLNERLDSQTKELRSDRKRIDILIRSVAGHERKRRIPERHQAEERSRSAPVQAPEEHSTRATKRFALQEVRASEFADALTKLLQARQREDEVVGIGVNERDNLIEVTASQEQLDAIEKVIKAVDHPTDEARIKIFPLENASAPELAEVLEDLFRQTRRRGEEALRIASDARTNSIIVIAPSEQLKKIEALLLSLDQPENKPDNDNDKTKSKSS